MLRGNAICLIDEATKAVLRVSSKPLTAQAGCIVRSIRADRLPPEVQALSETPVPFDIETVFLGHGKAAYLADDPKSVRIEVRESTDGEAEARHAELLARRFEMMEPKGLLESAIVGIVRLGGAHVIARAAVGLYPEGHPLNPATELEPKSNDGAPEPPTEAADPEPPKEEPKPAPAPKPERKTRKKVK